MRLVVMPFRNHKENNHTDTNQDTSKRNTQTSKQQSSVSTLDDATISISVKFSLNLASNMLNTLCLQQILISCHLHEDERRRAAAESTSTKNPLKNKQQKHSQLSGLK
jgi:hypothetical protein